MSNTATAELHRVLVAVDGSPSSIEAVRVGHRMSQLLGVPLVAVGAWHEHHGLFPPTTYTPEQDTRRDIGIAVREAFRPSPAPRIEVITVKGDPADSLVILSRQADLLVVGSRGHSGLVGTVLGSVSGHCAAHAGCPVLVVQEPHPPAESSSVQASEVKLEDAVT